jgi:hypothetical protein
MITLTIISVLYSIFGLMRFKNLYGHYNVFDENMEPWTASLVISTCFSFAMGIFFIVTYLP